MTQFTLLYAQMHQIALADVDPIPNNWKKYIEIHQNQK